MDTEILDLEQAMEFLRASERTMIKLLRDENVPARKIGREWRFTKNSLLEWLAKGGSKDYLTNMEEYKVFNDTKENMSAILEQINKSINKIKSNKKNIRALLPDMNEDIVLPDEATLRVSYKKQRSLGKLTFKIFWLINDQNINDKNTNDKK